MEVLQQGDDSGDDASFSSAIQIVICRFEKELGEKTRCMLAELLDRVKLVSVLVETLIFEWLGQDESNAQRGDWSSDVDYRFC